MKLPVERRDEFGELYRGFTRMAEQLEENAARLEESKRLLVTSEKMAALGRFSAGVAHEINNPLGIILNHVQLLRSGRLEEGERESFLARMETEIKRMNRLLRNLLQHATDEELAFSDLSLEAVVSEVVQLFTPKLRLKGVRVEVAPFPAGAVVEGDADAIKQVFFNLLYNAIQAIHHDHGLVRIDAEVNGGGCCVRVADNGEGMDEETRASIFQPFVTRKQGYGTGLGLALSQTIMKQHGGSIDVAGEPDVGTTVTLVVPPKGGGMLSPASRRGFSLLIVDDEEGMRLGLEKALSLEGYRVASAATRRRGAAPGPAGKVRLRLRGLEAARPERHGPALGSQADRHRRGHHHRVRHGGDSGAGNEDGSCRLSSEALRQPRHRRSCRPALSRDARRRRGARGIPW